MRILQIIHLRGLFLHLRYYFKIILKTSDFEDRKKTSLGHHSEYAYTSELILYIGNYLLNYEVVLNINAPEFRNF